MSQKQRADIPTQTRAERRGKGKEYQKPVPVPRFDEAEMRPTELIPRKYNMMIAWAVFAVTLLVYILTQARTLSFWDSGEYATCMSILGVPHPPGNPFYIVFGRAVVALFGGLISHAVIAAFLSGLASAFAVMLTYLITVQLVSMMKIKAWEGVFAGVVAAMLTAFSFTFWMNAVEAEVYAGLSVFVNLILWLTLGWVQKSRDMDHQNILLLIIYLFFLGFCVHQTALQLAPAVLFIVVYPLLREGIRKPNFWPKVIGYTLALVFGYLIFGSIGKGMKIDDFDKWGFALISFILLFIELKDVIDRRVWSIGIALVFIGLSSHLYLLVRAAARPFINEGHPSTWQRFQDYVLRKQYGETSFFVRRGHFFKDQMGFHFMRYIGWQWFNAEMLNKWFSIPMHVVKAIAFMFAGVLGFFGAAFQARRNRHSFFYFLSVILVTTVLMVFVMNISDREVRDRDYFFVVAYNMWAIWMGIGALGLLYVVKGKIGQITIVALISMLTLGNFVSQYHVHDRSREFIALDYGQNFLNSLEENAIIFTNGDNDTFPIWYAQAVHDPHAKEYLHKARDVYPTDASNQAIAKAMEFKNKYLKGIRKDVTVANLSLLNTPWYVKQLQDREGVIFNMSDDEINNMGRAYIGKSLFKAEASPQRPEMNIMLPLEDTPTWRKNEGGYRISDLAVLQIIKDNYGKRPIYFAVTCESMIGFDDYLRNEGMVNRLVHTKSEEREQVDVPRLVYNLDKVYEYRSIDDPRVYKDDNMLRLTMNYGAAFVRAATHFVRTKDFDKAKQYGERARSFVQDPTRLIEYYVSYYSGTGNWAELDKYIQNHVFTKPEGWQLYLGFVMQHLEEFYPDKVYHYYRTGLMQFPRELNIARYLAMYALENEEPQAAINLLRSVQQYLSYDVDEVVSYLTNPPPADAPVQDDEMM